MKATGINLAKQKEQKRALKKIAKPQLIRYLVFTYLLPVILITACASIFALRYTPAFTIANFYAEDGKTFTQTALNHNVIGSSFTFFNGYLILALHAITELALLVQSVLRLHFYQLPQVLALLSCGFLGLTAALPYILLRKQLGTVFTLLSALVICLVPIPSFDYAIIGTIGNLKFLFLFWAFQAVLYRNYNYQSLKKTILADGLLLLSIFTYAPAIALLPFALYPYRRRLIDCFQSKTLRRVFKEKTLVSLLVVGIISAIYLGVVYVRGIPPLHGYLDTPYNIHATPKLAYRSTLYAFLFPIMPIMRDLVSIIGLGIITYIGVFKSKSRFIYFFGLWAIFIATVSFVANRPGVSSYYMTYGPGPDQFFYGQTIIFAFIALKVLAERVGKPKLDKTVILILCLLTFYWWAMPATGSFGKNRVIYEHLGTAKHNIQTACHDSKNDSITFDTYPTDEWKWTVSKSIGCK